MNTVTLITIILLSVSLNFSACTGASEKTDESGFNHVMLYVSDLDRSVSFYEEAFGLIEHKRISRLLVSGAEGAVDSVQVKMAFLRFPGKKFVFELSERLTAGDSERVDRLYQHVGIEVKDIESSSEKALEAGAVSLNGIRTVSASGVVAKTAFFSGPDGEQVELMQIMKGVF